MDYPVLFAITLWVRAYMYINGIPYSFICILVRELGVQFVVLWHAQNRWRCHSLGVHIYAGMSYFDPGIIKWPSRVCVCIPSKIHHKNM